MVPSIIVLTGSSSIELINPIKVSSWIRSVMSQTQWMSLSLYVWCGHSFVILILKGSPLAIVLLLFAAVA